MRRFACPTCGQRVFFEDFHCLGCSAILGFDPEVDQVVVPADQVDPRTCDFRDERGCNWLVDGGGECTACAVEVDPPPRDVNVDQFRVAIRRLLRQFRVLGIDMSVEPELRFSLRSATPEDPVVIGHQNGLITLDVNEADPVYREETRLLLGEPYRTPLGHVRHEAGHWHWLAVVAPDPVRLAEFRELFGDETDDYQGALGRHYNRGDDDTWRSDYLSYYAAAHPWEDYAETFAHALHMSATMETARAEGLALPAWGTPSQRYQQWIDVTVAVNELSRSMGMADLYPFAPPPAAIRKIAFVSNLIPGARLA